MKKASIISVGNELLNGRTVDTNSVYLSERLLSMGIPTVKSYTVGDDIDLIVEVFVQASKGADIIIVTGGLGPTDDDLTRAGLARFMGAELEYRAELMNLISDFFRHRGLSMSEKNKVQSYVPVGTEALVNNVGTAPGIMAEHEGKLFFCLPGVPIEMERMFEESAADKLTELGEGQVVVTRRVKCFGTGESTIAQMLGNLMERGRNPLINCTVSGGVITLHVVATASEKSVAEAMVETKVTGICEILGDLVYSCDDEPLGDVVGRKLRERGKKIATAESCTGGLLGKLLTDVPGSSDYFICGWITYSNASKINELGVDDIVIKKCGAVSAEVAEAMATGCRIRSGADFGIGITGIAGPGGGSSEKPVGLVYIGVDFGGRVEVKRHVFSHSRGHIRLRAALTALNMLRLGMHD
jgi:nicotinamide-nucleotide amidase